MKLFLPLFLCPFFAFNGFAQPANDNCADAITVMAGEVVSFSTLEATTDGPFHDPATSPCPSNANDTLFRDVWYVFTPDFTGLADWSLCGTVNYDSKIAVYSPGTMCPAQPGDLLTCNDDGSGCTAAESRLIFDVDVGEKYLLRLGGWGETAPGEAGTGTFVIDEFESTLPNDFCFQAQPVMLGMGQMFTNVGAITDGPDHPNDPACFGFNDITVQADIWYSFTAPSSTTIEWSTCNQINFDSRLAIYNAGATCPLEDGDIMACNDDGSGCSGFTSRVVFDVVQGETYLLRLGGFGGEQGNGTFDLFETTPPVPPANDLCVDADSAWIVTQEQFDDFEMPIEGTTINGTFDQANWITPNAQCFGAGASGEYSTVWYWFNTFGNETIDISLFKGIDGEGASFYVEMFETCGVQVDTNVISGSCLFASDTEVFDMTTVTGLPSEPTIYLLRITTRLTTQLPGDFFLFIVGDITSGTIESYPGEFNLFPNPVNNTLHLNLALKEIAETDIRIMNSLGQTVVHEDKGRLGTGFHQFNFDTGSLSKGIYFLVMQSEQGMSTVKFIKE